MNKQTKGFTLIELMIVIAIIGILASVAIPMYGHYLKRAKFTEVLLASTPVKRAIENCLTVKFDTSACNSWAEIGMTEAQVMSTTDLIDTITINTSNAAFTFTGHSEELNGATYILTPSFNENTNILSWTHTGTCKTDAAKRFC